LWFTPKKMMKNFQKASHLQTNLWTLTPNLSNPDKAHIRQFLLLLLAGSRSSNQICNTSEHAIYCSMPRHQSSTTMAYHGQRWQRVFCWWTPRKQ
jgi:hypothetical protein